MESLRQVARPGKRRSLEGEADGLIEGLFEEGDPRRRILAHRYV